MQARGIVGHDVGVSWEVGRFVAVAVEALVQAGVVAQVGGGAIRGDGALSGARDGRSVITTIEESRIGAVMVVGHDAHLCEESRLF